MGVEPNLGVALDFAKLCAWLTAKTTIYSSKLDCGLATGLHVSQLRKLLQTYFGARRHCLVCSSTVVATDFAASGS
jgi:hypothetical protein